MSLLGPGFLCQVRSLYLAGPSPLQKGLSRRHIMSAVEASLERLQTPYIDLYQVRARVSEWLGWCWCSGVTEALSGSMSVLVWVAAASDSCAKSTFSLAVALLFRELRPCASHVLLQYRV